MFAISMKRTVCRHRKRRVAVAETPKSDDIPAANVNGRDLLVLRETATYESKINFSAAQAPEGRTRRWSSLKRFETP